MVRVDGGEEKQERVCWNDNRRMDSEGRGIVVIQRTVTLSERGWLGVDGSDVGELVAIDGRLIDGWQMMME